MSNRIPASDRPRFDLQVGDRVHFRADPRFRGYVTALRTTPKGHRLYCVSWRSTAPSVHPLADLGYGHPAVKRDAATNRITIQTEPPLDITDVPLFDLAAHA